MVLTRIRNALGSNPRENNEHSESGFRVYPHTLRANFRTAPQLCHLGLNPFYFITN